MTTFQDPPPQSRRAVRQSERGGSSEQVGVEQVALETQPYSFDVSQEQVSAPTAPPVTPHTGRRVQLDAGAPGQVEVRQAPAAVSEPVTASAPETETTAVPADPDDQTRNATPVRTRRELREIRAAQEQRAPALALPEPIDALLNSGAIEIPTLAPAPGQSQALAEAMAEFDQLTKDRRDTESRARDQQVASLAAAKLAVPVLAPSVPVPAAPAAASSAPVAPPLIEPSPTVPAPSQWSPPPPTGPSVPQAPPAAVKAAEAAAAEAAVVEAEPSDAAVVETDAVEAVVVDTDVVDTDAVDKDVVDTDAVDTDAVEAVVVEAGVVEAVVVETDVVEAEAVGTDVVEADVVEAVVESDVDPVSAQPINASNRPSGHWSVQAAIEDDETPFENTLSRTVGTGTSAITTSALVLPSVPQASDLTRPFASTGEILMTGSIDLPHSLGSTGAHPHRIDNSDFEDDPLDSQIAAPDSAPVRAIRAVSTHTSTRGVIENKKPQNNRWLTRVIIGVSTLLVVGVGLLVYVLVTHTY